ncbi:MAG: histidine phosphatase family protein [Defluviitaleaceae bacterium]|nr:histidine phosphatase family protein [Defluviitaleaceae bacterium]
MKIFTVRHGQTDCNLISRIQGHTNSPLNEAGLEQAKRIGRRLSREKVDIIYTSDLIRAAKTAEEINSHHGVELVPNEALREFNFGIFEGRIYGEVAHEIEYHYNKGLPMPNGESINENFKKIHNYLDEITAKNHQNVILVGHFGTVRAAICYFLGMSIEERHKFYIDNTAIHCFERGDDGKFRMILENDVSHLG